MEAMEAGTLVGDKYLLVRQIGRGGMGAVWAARNVRTEREVALKLITDENADYRARLLREARACGRISHRNVIEIYDVGETASGAPFLVMPLLEGEPLSRKLRRDGAMAPPIAAQIATEIARALSAAHAAGIIHRDLKPANIYLHREPGSEMLVVKVLDFGISKVVSTDSTTTTTGTILGSPAYMSPEQAKGERYVDHRSDLWSLGVTLFEMLTGRRPFQGESMFTVVAAVLGGPVPHVRELLPHIDPGLAEVAARCMERELDYRAQSADEIVHMLRPYAAGYLPLDLSAFGASGFHPVASMSQMPTAPHMADSASVPPVHFAAPWGGPPGAPTIASGPPGCPARVVPVDLGQHGERFDLGVRRAATARAVRAAAERAGAVLGLDDGRGVDGARGAAAARALDERHGDAGFPASIEDDGVDRRGDGVRGAGGARGGDHRDVGEQRADDDGGPGRQRARGVAGRGRDVRRSGHDDRGLARSRPRRADRQRPDRQVRAPPDRQVRAPPDRQVRAPPGAQEGSRRARVGSPRRRRNRGNHPGAGA
jgi:hypothetical protein